MNKVSTAVHLRFDIAASSLPDEVKARLLASNEQRITAEGVIVIKAQTHRRQNMNRADALQRLQEMVDKLATPPRPRKPTKPSYGSKIATPRRQGPPQRSEDAARQAGGVAGPPPRLKRDSLPAVGGAESGANQDPNHPI